MSDNIIFYGRVEEKAVKKLLYQGTLKGALGLLLLPYSFILGALLIGWGFLPYNRLKALSNAPPTLHLTSEALTYLEGKKKISFPLQEIKNVRYDQEKIFVELSCKTIPLPPFFSFKTFQELQGVLDSNENND
jgi:hypothetical protein